MLSAAAFLRVWDVARAQRPGGLGMTFLSGLAGLSRDTASKLSVGERDQFLSELRERLFGRTIECRSDCPDCREMLECSIDLAQLRQLPGMPAERERIVESDGLTLHWRLPTAGDLEAVSVYGNSHAARRALLQLCLIKGCGQDGTIVITELPLSAETSFSEFVQQCDPGAESVIELACPNCQRVWNETFDIVSLLWTDLNELACRLLHEVHDLASAYGWTEENILNLSAARRAAYLELCGS